MLGPGTCLEYFRTFGPELNAGEVRLMATGAGNKKKMMERMMKKEKKKHSKAEHFPLLLWWEMLKK